MSVNADRDAGKENPASEKQNVLLENRSVLTLTGIDNVVSFDENFVVLSSSAGLISIDGGSMHIISMNVDEGDMVIKGRIDGIGYSEGKMKGASGFFGKKKK